MIARLERGEGLLTTRMSNVFLRFRQSVLAGDAQRAPLDPNCVLVGPFPDLLPNPTKLIYEDALPYHRP